MTGEMGSAASSGASAVRTTFGEAFGMIAEYGVPILGVLAGLALAIQIGGAGIPYQILGTLNPQWVGTPGLGAFAKFVMAGVYGAGAFAFHHLYSRSGTWGKAIFGFVMGFSAGSSIRWLGQGITNTPTSGGWLDSIGSTFQNQAAQLAPTS